MVIQMKKTEWTRPASSGSGLIFPRLWTEEQPKAILGIAHGMAEHSARYASFAEFLTAHGFAVCMNDHAGHGKSAQVKGHFADENGWEFVVDDLKALLDEVSGRYPGLPVFLMGHSMGSFLSRSFLTRYGGMLQGCILCGTMGKNPALGLGKALAGLQKKVLGPRSRGKLIDKLAFGSYNKRIENPVNQFAWLSTVEQVCREYAADEFCGFEFTAAGYYDLFSGLQEVNSPKWAQEVPKNLPVFLLAGDADPVGNYGKGPTEVAEALKAAGCGDVSLKLYPGKRHELLNESNRQEVYADVLRWLEKKLESGM